MILDLAGFENLRGLRIPTIGLKIPTNLLNIYLLLFYIPAIHFYS
jgi:hypothetical protein